jgi:hypothetical protein
MKRQTQKNGHRHQTEMGADIKVRKMYENSIVNELYFINT